ncbi:MAG TPA: helix-turn-helix transcriptional regulator [Streptosporangiaceae bacterium]
MSPVFRHGKLRLYLLKLLDEAPRHGYEVIRLLQDRFMGIYAPSPGTIYPRLARLEEDGLVTHEEVDGKKIYSITDKGREEIRSRLGDLADLEDELTESLRDVAREISVDVRETVRTIREELASAAKGFRNADGRTTDDRTTDGRDDAGQTEQDAAESDGASEDDAAEPRRIREEARRSREQMRASFRQGRRAADWPAWSAWSEWADNDGEAGSASGPGSRGRAQAAGAGHGGQGPFGDLERMAMQFATELRAAARQTGNLGDRSLNELRDILTDTLARVRSEVFTDPGAKPDSKPDSKPGQPSPGAPGDGDHD